MKYYAAAEIEVTDPGWVRDYVRETTALVEARGGRYLARTANAEIVEGAEPTPGRIHLLIEWPSKAVAEAFYESEEYRPHRDARQAGSRGEFRLIAGEDMTGAAKI